MSPVHRVHLQARRRSQAASDSSGESGDEDSDWLDSIHVSSAAQVEQTRSKARRPDCLDVVLGVVDEVAAEQHRLRTEENEVAAMRTECNTYMKKANHASEALADMQREWQQALRTETEEVAALHRDEQQMELAVVRGRMAQQVLDMKRSADEARMQAMALEAEACVCAAGGVANIHMPTAAAAATSGWQWWW